MCEGSERSSSSIETVAELIRREPPPAESIWAAGCVLYRSRDDGRAEYLVVHRPRYDDWSLPKGKLDKGETFIEGAVRETREETGFPARDPKLVGTIAYDTKAGNPKVVRWWVASAGKGRFTPNEEVDRIKWVTFKKGRKRLTYRNDREVLDRANDMVHARSAGMIYLVRHAWAGKRGDASNDDWARPLDKRGLRQRDELGRLLRAHPLTRIGTSDYARCIDTVEPLSELLGIPVERESALVEGSHPERLRMLIHDLQEESAVLCSHGDVIGDLIGQLFADSIPMDGEQRWQKGSIWELRTVAGRVVAGRYISPPV